MGDYCRTVTIEAWVQENGIIRVAPTGMYIGRLDDITFEEVSRFSAESTKRLLRRVEAAIAFHNGEGTQDAPTMNQALAEVRAYLKGE